ncbi:hypothetical protein BKA93DRAFT_828198 [Sparassis latifolia]
MREDDTQTSETKRNKSDHPQTIALSAKAGLAAANRDATYPRFSVQLRPKEICKVFWELDHRAFSPWECSLIIKDAKPTSSTYKVCPIRTLNLDFYSISQGRSLPRCQIWFIGRMAPCIIVGQDYEMKPEEGIVVSPSVYIPPDLMCGEDAAGGMWLLQFWVPIPMGLFIKCPCRKFRVKARLQLETCEGPESEAEAICESTVDVVMEHLQLAKLISHVET